MPTSRSPLAQFFNWIAGKNTGESDHKSTLTDAASVETEKALKTTPGSTQFLAPLTGRMIPLEQVDDPVFAQRIVGDGVAILPSCSKLTAPCDGKVVNVAGTCHALSLKTNDDIEILFHIGIDTVAMGGNGFKSLVVEGQNVSRGDTLIEFDLNRVKQEAPSSVTLMLITNKSSIKTLEAASGDVTTGIDRVMSVVWNRPESSGSEETSAENVKLIEVQIPNPQGWHARPAAQLGALSREFSGKLVITKDGKQANSTSVVQLMALNTRCGDKVELRASGRDATELLEAAVTAIKSGLGDTINKPSPITDMDWEQEPPLLSSSQVDGSICKGVRAAPGLGWGRAEILTDIRSPASFTPENLDEEDLRLESALHTAIERLKVLASGSDEASEIFSAQIGLLDDPEVQRECKELVAKGLNAEQALFSTIEDQIKTLIQLDNELIAGRAADLRDVRQRVLRILRKQPQDISNLPEGCVIVVDELVPSVAAALHTDRIQAVLASQGGAFSHGAIIARAKGIPAVFALGQQIEKMARGTMLLVRADEAMVELAPSQEHLDRLIAEQKEQRSVREEANKYAHEKAITKDGFEVEVAANIANEAEAHQAVTFGADGVGLLRSEFLFLNRASAPDEEEQYQTYSNILKAMNGRPLIIRTLDVGGDKPLPYLKLPAEDNPFLGERGIRVGIHRPALLRQQLRALIRASAQGPLKIMVPMISSLIEYRAVREFAQSIADDLGLPLCPLGMMIEVPSAALQAEQFAREADFFSIGSNDLTQYVTAVDRGHAGLDYLADPLHPAVLRLMHETAQAGQRNNTWVGLCGGLAGDPEATPLLVAMGLNELSVSAPVVGEIKQKIRQLNKSNCQQLLSQCLGVSTSDDVKALLNTFWNQ